MSKEAARELAIRELEERHSKERESFAHFVRTFYEKYYGREFIWNWHYDKICGDLEDLYNEKIELLIINIPPRSGKTEIVSMLFPLWCMGRDPFFKVMSTGYSAELTKTFSERTRNYYQSTQFKEIFPRREDLKKESIDHWGNDKCHYRSAGVGGTLTGIGANLIIFDDPINPSDVQVSGLSMDRANIWFSGTMASRFDRIHGKNLAVVVMQRLHDNDTTGYLLRRFSDRFDSGRWRHLLIDAELTEDGKEGSFFPELFPIDFLERQRDIMTTEYGSNFYAAQYRQNPIDVDSSEFRRSQFRYYEESDDIEFIKSYIAVDPAISEKKQADNSAICVVSRDKEGNFYRRAGWAGRVPPDELLSQIFKFFSAYNCPVIVESIGFQQTIVQNIRKEMINRGIRFPLIEIKTRTEKHERILMSLQPKYMAYQIFHNKKDEYSSFEDELLRFPKGRHDDQIDAFATAVDQFSAHVKKSTWDEKELEKMKKEVPSRAHCIWFKRR